MASPGFELWTSVGLYLTLADGLDLSATTSGLKMYLLKKHNFSYIGQRIRDSVIRTFKMLANDN